MWEQSNKTKRQNQNTKINTGVVEKQKTRGLVFWTVPRGLNKRV
jgi:hypothetical protein